MGDHQVTRLSWCMCCVLVRLNQLYTCQIPYRKFDIDCDVKIESFYCVHGCKKFCTVLYTIEYPSNNMQVLYLEGGYKILNVCSERERDFGAIRGSIHVPYTKDKKSWIDNQMKIEKTKVDPATFLKAVNAKIPKKDTKLIVHDMIGKQVTSLWGLCYILRDL